MLSLFIISTIQLMKLTVCVYLSSMPLVYHVLLDLKRKLPVAEVFRLVNNKPQACNLLESYFKEQDPELLKNFYYQDDRYADEGNLSLLESFQQKDVTERINKVKVALKLYQDAKDHPFEEKVPAALEKRMRKREKL